VSKKKKRKRNGRRKEHTHLKSLNEVVRIWGFRSEKAIKGAEAECCTEQDGKRGRTVMRAKEKLAHAKGQEDY